MLCWHQPRVVRMQAYAYLVPYVEDEKEIFLKTIIPSRKFTRSYLGGDDEKPRLPEAEQELLDAVEKGEFESALNDVRREALEDVAANTFRKDKRINIRISNRDLRAVQSRAR